MSKILGALGPNGLILCALTIVVIGVITLIFLSNSTSVNGDGNNITQSTSNAVKIGE